MSFNANGNRARTDEMITGYDDLLEKMGRINAIQRGWYWCDGIPLRAKTARSWAVGVVDF